MNFKGYSKWLVWLLLALLCLTFSGCASKGPETEVVIPITDGTMAAQGTLDFAATDQANLAQVQTPVGQGASNSGTSNCTYTPNYWKNNPDKWLTVNFILGRFTYTKEQALALYASADSDERSAILREFVSAALNILNGADPSTIEPVLSDASSWIDNHPVGIQISPADMQAGNELAAKLQAYNNGQIGPGLCADEPTPPAPTQTATLSPTPTYTNTVPPAVGITATPVTSATPKPRTNPGGPDIEPTQNPVVQPTQAPTKQQEQPTQAPPTQPPPPPPTDVPPTPAPPPPTDAPPPVEQPTNPAAASTDQPAEPVPATP
jgi:hypothetical protein